MAGLLQHAQCWGLKKLLIKDETQLTDTTVFYQQKLS